MPTLPALPWHYLGALVSLTAGKTLNGLNLIDNLLALEDDSALLDALDQNQPNGRPSGNPTGDGLFHHAKTIAENGAKEEYTWSTPWPTGMTVRLRSGLMGPVLSPTEITLPWPFPGNSGKLLRNRLEGLTESTSTIDVASTFDATTEVNLFPLMRAAEDAVSPSSPLRSTFEAVRGTGCANEAAWVIQRAQQEYGGGDFPETLQICSTPASLEPEDVLATYQTGWDVVEVGSPAEPALFLRLGWTNVPTTCSQSRNMVFLSANEAVLNGAPTPGIVTVANGTVTIQTALRPLFDSWPTGFHCDE